MYKLKYFLIAFLAISLFACEDDITDLNIDEKNPTSVSAGTLFANAEVTLMDYMASTNVNVNNWRLWAQHWTQTQYTDEANYDLVTRDVHGRTMATLYAAVLTDLKESKSLLANDPLATEAEITVQEGMIETLEVFTWSILVDTFGDVPYSEAFQGRDNMAPAYDDDEAIYADLFTRLDAAITKLGGASSGDFGSSDLIYGGSPAAWSKFANSLKLRMAVRISGVSTANASTYASQAISAGVFDSNADNFSIVYQSATPNTNPLWVDLVQSGRSDFVLANTLSDVMNDLDDPRRPEYGDPSTFDVNGDMIGGVYGAEVAYATHTHVGTKLIQQTFPHQLMDYSEVAFLRAHAGLALGTGDDPATWYENGIRASMDLWGVGSDKQDAYMLNPDVAYATATGSDEYKIGKQKWIAMYNRPFEAWTTYRMYPIEDLFNVAAAAGTLSPLRFTYPPSEYSLNRTNVEAAASAIGGDELMTPVFWDVD